VVDKTVTNHVCNSSAVLLLDEIGSQIFKSNNLQLVQYLKQMAMLNLNDTISYRGLLDYFRNGMNNKQGMDNDSTSDNVA
jgi:hypothetical protein